MKRDAHRKLLTLLCFAMVMPLALVAACNALPAEQKARALFATSDQMLESFDQIVPGMTRADDLPSLGFDTHAADTQVLSSRDLARHFGAADGAAQACIAAGVYCTGFVFHPAADPGLFARVRSAGRQADIVLLVMNGRVVHKVFADGPDGRVAVARAF